MGISVRTMQRIETAHARREQRLVPVAHGRVGQQQPLLSKHPIGDGARPFFIEHLLDAGNRLLTQQSGRFWRPRIGWRLCAPSDFRVLINGDVSNVIQKLRRAVAAAREFEQFWMGVDELRSVVVRDKIRMVDEVFDEDQIGRNTPDVELAKRGPCAGSLLGAREPRL